MRRPALARVKTALGVLAIAAAAATLSGCGNDDVDQVTKEIKEQGEELRENAREAGEAIKDEAEDVEDDLSGDDTTTTTSGDN
jgi:gas vesicle protein